MLNIPDFVPKDLVEELEACQKQLKILLGNYKVLRERNKANPEDETTQEQLKQVEKYLIQYNDKQMPIIKQIRELTKSQENGLNSSKSSDEDSSSIKNDEDKQLSEEEILESLGLKDVARTAEGKVDHAKLSMKDRMAIVRGMRKRRKKGAVAAVNSPGNPLGPPPSKKPAMAIGTPAITANEPETESNNETNEALQLVNEDQYNGFVLESEKFEAKPPSYDDSDCNELEKRKVETFIQNCNQTQFLANLELFTPKEVDTVLEAIDNVAKRKLDFRNMTYIPEMSDKKHKTSYTYLAADFNSPPLLRTRQRRQVTNSNINSTTASRMTSRSNSRATTPDRSITRQLSTVSNDSNESHVSNNKKESSAEKSALESELAELSKRWEELQSVLNANKRTISTRKERSRLSEVSVEATQLNTRINEIKKNLAK